MTLLPWVALGGLFYLMAKNSAKVATAGTAATSTPAATCSGLVTDFGVANANCWCG